MFGDLIEQGLELRDILSESGICLDPFAKDLIIVTDSEQIVVQPQPRIELVSISPEAVEGISDLRGVVKKFDVSGISKTYSQILLEQEGITFLIESTPCHLVPGTLKEGAISWALQLQVALIEQENFYE